MKVPSTESNIRENNSETDFLERLARNKFVHWFDLQVPSSVHVHKCMFEGHHQRTRTQKKEPLMNLSKFSIRTQSVKFLFVFLSSRLSVLHQFVLLVNLPHRNTSPFFCPFRILIRFIYFDDWWFLPRILYFFVLLQNFYCRIHKQHLTILNVEFYHSCLL